MPCSPCDRPTNNPAGSADATGACQDQLFENGEFNAARKDSAEKGKGKGDGGGGGCPGGNCSKGAMQGALGGMPGVGLLKGLVGMIGRLF